MLVSGQSDGIPFNTFAALSPREVCTGANRYQTVCNNNDACASDGVIVSLIKILCTDSNQPINYVYLFENSFVQLPEMVFQLFVMHLNHIVCPMKEVQHV